MNIGKTMALKAPETFFLFRFKIVRQFVHILERTPPFFAAVFSSRGIFHPEGRQLIRGKFRRGFLSFFPSVAQRVQKHYGLQGSCTGCGASCNMLFRCPQWDPKTRQCTVYEDRPNICKTFPITPADLKDRATANRNQPCGFTFQKTGETKSPK
jgi:hypothetical protein